MPECHTCGLLVQCADSDERFLQLYHHRACDAYWETHDQFVLDLRAEWETRLIEHRKCEAEYREAREARDRYLREEREAKAARERYLRGERDPGQRLEESIEQHQRQLELIQQSRATCDEERMAWYRRQGVLDV